MNPFALALVIASTFLHAGWNLMMRRRKSEAAAFMFRMTLLTVVVGFVPAVVSELLTRSMPPAAWGLVAVSGVCCGLYSFFLVMGYEAGDFTVVYPVARALPVVLVGLGDVLRGRDPSVPGWAGMALVVAGCVLVPHVSWRGISLRSYFNRATVYMVLTALGTVGYSLLDKVALEIVEPGFASAMRYAYFFFLGNFIVFAVLRHIFHPRSSKRPTIGWGLPALGAVMGYVAYGLILWVYQMVGRASYVVAFRQFSIVIGVVIAFAVFREKGRSVRLTAALLITAGLLVIGLFGGGQ